MRVSNEFIIKNIIVINDFSYEQGGATKVAIDTANMLIKKKFHVAFISALSHNNSDALDMSIERYSLENGMEFKNYDNKIKGLIDGIHNFEFTKLVAKVLKKFDPKDTVVHVHGWTKGCSASFFSILKELKFTTVVTLHEYFSMCANGAYFDYKTKMSCMEYPGTIKCLLRNCDSRNCLYKLYRTIRQMFYRKYMDFNYIHVIFVSEFQSNIIQRFLSIKHSKVIENPFCCNYLERKDCRIKKWDYIYIGRNTVEKGVDLFIKLAEDFPDKKFVFVGIFHDKVPQNVFVTGWVFEEQVFEYLCCSRVLVFPSLWPETFGLNVFKAIKIGIPCLVSSNTAAEKYIVKGNGVVFHQGDYNDMRKKAEEVLSVEPKVLPVMDNSNEVYIEKIVEFYHESLKSNCVNDEL